MDLELWVFWHGRMQGTAFSSVLRFAGALQRKCKHFNTHGLSTETHHADSKIHSEPVCSIETSGVVLQERHLLYHAAQIPVCEGERVYARNEHD